MGKFIFSTTANGAECLINTEHILCVIDKTEKTEVSIVLDQHIYADHNCIEVKDTYKKIVERILE